MTWRSFIGGLICAAGLMLAQAAAPAAQPPSPLPQVDLEAALALPVASGLVGARDAARFAWVESAAGIDTIWVADRGRPALQITSHTEDDGQQFSDLELSRDGSKLAYVRGGDEEFPDDDLPNASSAAETPKQQVFFGMVGGGAPVLIGDGHSPAFSPAGDRIAYTRKGELWLWEGPRGARRLASVAGDVTRLQWSPDGARLLFVDNRRDHSFVALLDIAEGRLRYLSPGLGYAVEPIFSPDGRRVAFIRYVEPPAGAAASDDASYWSIRVADAATGQSHELWAAPPGTGGRYYGTRSRNLFWSADGQIVFPWERSGWVHAYAVNASSGGAPKELTPGAFEVESFLLGADGRSIIYAANAEDIDRRHIWRRPLAGGGAARLTAGSGIESSPTLAGDALAVIATDVTHPAYPALSDRTLSPLRKVAAARGFVTSEPVVFRAQDGVEVHGQLFRARASGKRPALVFVHGGPRRQMLLGFHPSGYYSKTYVMNQYLASKGYDVLAVNYRSGTGYGLAFRDAPEIARSGASEYRDVLAAGRWLAARPDVDPARIGIWGGSWGGYLTALALARDSALFSAGVDFHGVHTLLRPVPDTLSPDAQMAARQLQWQSSPLGAIESWRSPVLLVHGNDDRNVPFSQSLLLARELAARRIPYRDIAFPNERHSFFVHKHWLQALRAADAFFGETLMQKAPTR